MTSSITEIHEPESSPLRAILCWPKGIDFPPVIYPLGGTYELDEAIRRFLNKAFEL